MQEDICVQETPVMVTPIKPYKMIATRGVVVFPGDTVSFEIIRDKSLAALQKASESGEDIFVVSQKHSSTVKPAHIKTSRSPSPKDECFFTFANHFVEKTEAFDFVGSLVLLSQSAFQDRQLVNLPVVLSGLLLKEKALQSLCTKVVRNAVRVCAVALCDPV